MVQLGETMAVICFIGQPNCCIKSRRISPICVFTVVQLLYFATSVMSTNGNGNRDRPLWWLIKLQKFSFIEFFAEKFISMCVQAYDRYNIIAQCKIILPNRFP